MMQASASGHCPPTCVRFHGKVGMVDPVVRIIRLATTVRTAARSLHQDLPSARALPRGVGRGQLGAGVEGFANESGVEG